MTTASTPVSGAKKAQVHVQRFGTFLSGMIMPNIPALIAWGIITMFFIPDGFTPNEALSTMVGPMIHYLLPLIIAYTGGHMVYGIRGGVVGAVATLGAIAGSDYIIAQFNAAALAENAEATPLGDVHMFIGAMILGPLTAYTMKWLDKLWDGKIKAGFEMLVNMFSAGIWAFVMAVVGFYPIAIFVNWLMAVLGVGVEWLIDNSLLPLTSILIEPAKVLFLNNAINHGVLTPLGLQQVAEDGKSILFLLEANPGPGLGLLLAFTFFGIGAARASAPGAAVIQFVGGIHEVYFPFALMKPILILALIAGGMTGVTTNMLFQTGSAVPRRPRKHPRDHGGDCAGRSSRRPAVGGLRGRGDVHPRLDHAPSHAQARSARRGRPVRLRRLADRGEQGQGLSGARRARCRGQERQGGAARGGRGRRPSRDRGRDRRPRRRRDRHHPPGEEHRVRVRRGHGLFGDGRERPAQQDQEGGLRRCHGREQGDREPRLVG